MCTKAANKKLRTLQNDVKCHFYKCCNELKKNKYKVLPKKSRKCYILFTHEPGRLCLLNAVKNGLMAK